MTDRRAEFRALHHAGRPAAAAQRLGPRLGGGARRARPPGDRHHQPRGRRDRRPSRRHRGHRGGDPRPGPPAARLPVLLSVDVEAGFSDDPAAVAGYVAELAGLGVVGINLEDGRADGTLADPGSPPPRSRR